MDTYSFHFSEDVAQFLLGKLIQPPTGFEKCQVRIVFMCFRGLLKVSACVMTQDARKFTNKTVKTAV